MKSASLVRGNALAIPLADDSVDLVVTSPPYFALRSYQDGGEHLAGQIGGEETPQAFVEALWAVTRECARVLKPSGSIFVNLGDKYSGAGGPGGDYNEGGLRSGQPRIDAQSYWSRMAPATSGIPAKSLMFLPERFRIGCVDQLGLIARAVIVWSKPNGLPDSARDRVARSHEDWVHFTKMPTYFSAVDEVREPNTGRSQAGGPWLERNEGQVLGRAEAPHCGLSDYQPNPLGKRPGSVWTISSEPLVVPEHVGVDHFAAFPQEWARRLILGWSPSGVCTACGEGRRPVVEKGANGKEREDLGGGGRGRPGVRAELPGRTTINRTPWRENVTREVTGYTCACPGTSAPTRPAVVLDPFAGTGTVPMVARVLGRYGVGLDLSADYLRLARWRVFESGHARKSIARTAKEAQQEMAL